MQISSARTEAQQLRDENESLAAQVTASMERPATEGRENGDVTYAETKHIDTNSDKYVIQSQRPLSTRRSVSEYFISSHSLLSLRSHSLTNIKRNGLHCHSKLKTIISCCYNTKLSKQQKL